MFVYPVSRAAPGPALTLDDATLNKPRLNRHKYYEKLESNFVTFAKLVLQHAAPGLAQLVTGSD